MSWMLLVMLLLSISMLSSSSPIVFIILIITQTLCICLSMKLLSYSPIFSMILFLIFIGGMMVLFSYIVSLTPNNSVMTPLQLLLSNKMILLLSFILLMMSIFFSLKINLIETNTMNKPFINILTSIFNVYSHSMWIVFMMFFLLLLTLIIVVFCVLTNSGPMRSLTMKLN
uniref:NADH dehydrogenase subunit 6 n=1 Tax=Bilobella aurantiaca TaxID=106915 RepID=B5KMD0_BILAU|nr:NADH dehydrogenase subunit 6 [Bilobella aurantiaca]ABS88973.1 NADH dehydrogenase subunit 6 [Bilobella aurantiaca]